MINLQNDGLPKEFYVTFWDDIKTTFISSIKQATERKQLKAGNN